MSRSPPSDPRILRPRALIAFTGVLLTVWLLPSAGADTGGVDDPCLTEGDLRVCSTTSDPGEPGLPPLHVAPPTPDDLDTDPDADLDPTTLGESPCLQEGNAGFCVTQQHWQEEGCHTSPDSSTCVTHEGHYRSAAAYADAGMLTGQVRIEDLDQRYTMTHEDACSDLDIALDQSRQEAQADLEGPVPTGARLRLEHLVYDVAREDRCGQPDTDYHAEIDGASINAWASEWMVTAAAGNAQSRVVGWPGGGVPDSCRELTGTEVVLYRDWDRVASLFAGRWVEHC